MTLKADSLKLLLMTLRKTKPVMPNQFTELTDRKLLALTGKDVNDFLQGLISNDLQKLTADTPLYALLLTPQGKLMFDFLLYRLDDKIVLDGAADSASALAKRLGFYKLRADVTIEELDEKVFALWGDDLPETGLTDPRHEGLGKRFIGTLPPNSESVSLTDYKAHRLCHLVLEGMELGAQSSFPLEFRLDEHNAIDFQKGCFVGQEVTSRIYRRGTIRKKTYLIKHGGTVELGQDVQANGRTIGKICAIEGQKAVALLRTDSLDQPLQAGSIPIQRIE